MPSSPGMHHGFYGQSVIAIGRPIIEQLEANDASGAVLHEDHLVGGLFADVLLAGIVEPNGQCMAYGVVDHFHFSHIDSPSLTASVGPSRPRCYAGSSSLRGAGGGVSALGAISLPRAS